MSISQNIIDGEISSAVAGEFADVWLHIQSALRPPRFANHSVVSLVQAMALERAARQKARIYRFSDRIIDGRVSLLVANTRNHEFIAQYNRLPFDRVFFDFAVGGLKHGIYSERHNGLVRSAVFLEPKGSGPLLIMLLDWAEGSRERTYEWVPPFSGNSEQGSEISMYPMLLTCALNIQQCSVVTPFVFPEKLQLARQKRGKWALASFNEVTLRAAAPKKACSETHQFHNSSQRRHERAGHPKIPFRKDGRAIPIWIEPYWAGDISKGIVLKNRNV